MLTTLAKQFLRLGDQTCFSTSMRSLDLKSFDRIVLGCRSEFLSRYDFGAYLKTEFPEMNIEICLFDESTKGSLDTVFKMLIDKKFSKNAQLTIFTLDVEFDAPKLGFNVNGDADILVVKTNNPVFRLLKLIVRPAMFRKLRKKQS